MSAAGDVNIWPRRLVALGLLAAIGGSSTPIPLYPVYRATLELDAFTMTIIFVVYLMGVLVALFSMSRLLDFLRNPYRLLAPALVLVIVAALLMGTAHTLPALILGRLIAGLGTGCVTVAANAALVDLTPGRDPRVAGVISGLAFSTGSGVGPIVSGAALQWNIWPLTLPFLLVAILAGIALFTPIQRWHAEGLAERAPKRGQSDDAPSPGTPIPWGPVLLCIGVILMNWSVGATLMALGPYFGDLIFGVESYAVSGYAVSLYMITAATSQWAHRRTSLPQALARGSWAIVLGGIGILMACLTTSLPLAVVGMFIAAIGNGAVFGAAAALINLVAPAVYRSRLVSLFFASGYIGSLLPMALGAITDHYGALVAATGYAACVSAAFILIALISQKLVPRVLADLHARSAEVPAGRPCQVNSQ